MFLENTHLNLEAKGSRNLLSNGSDEGVCACVCVCVCAHREIKTESRRGGK